MVCLSQVGNTLDIADVSGRARDGQPGVTSVQMKAQGRRRLGIGSRRGDPKGHGQRGRQRNSPGKFRIHRL